MRNCRFELGLGGKLFMCNIVSVGLHLGWEFSCEILSVWECVLVGNFCVEYFLFGVMSWWAIVVWDDVHLRHCP